MAKIGKYIYGIIPRKSEGEMPVCEEVYALAYEGIAAVISDSEIIDYTRMFKDVLAKLLIRHQKVIEKIMGLGYTVIPMKLGTFATDENEIKNILCRGYGLANGILKKIRNDIEIDVAVTWSDFSAVLKEAGEKEEIKVLKERFLSNAKTITVDDQMKVGLMIKKILDGKREEYAKEIQSVLRSSCQDFRSHELMDDKMVANFAFLIDKTMQRDFDKKVEDLNAKFHETLNFRCVGPLPPYSFYTLEIKKMRFEEIDWARKRLGLLNASASSDEIKKAYQKATLCSHPDHNPNVPGIEKEFNDVVKAYNALVDYGRACVQAGHKECLSFDKVEFENNAILVKIKG